MKTSIRTLLIIGSLAFSFTAFAHEGHEHLDSTSDGMQGMMGSKSSVGSTPEGMMKDSGKERK